MSTHCHPRAATMRSFRAALIPILLATLTVSISATIGPRSAQAQIDPSTVPPAMLKDKRFQRFQHIWRQRALPDGNIPAGAFQRALLQREQQKSSLLATGQVPAINFGSWTSIGPDRLSFNPAATAGDSGRLVSIAVHPTDSNTIYAAGAQGGVWKTTNGGTSWTPLTDTQCSTAMGSIALDRVNPNIVYAGTGELHFSLDSYYGCGVLRSTDGGTTWTQLGAANFTTPGGQGAKFSKVLIDNATAGSTTTTKLIAATDRGLFRSLDSGQTWSLVSSGTFTDAVQDPSNSQIFYAAAGFLFSSASNGVYKSVDGGASFTKLAGGFPTTNVGRINLAIAPSQPTKLLASIQSSATFGLLGIFQSTDSGATWAGIPATGASCASQCWYDMHIQIHPTDPNTIYFGGFSLYKSTNGGTSFTDIGTTLHVDHHSFAFDPANPSIIFAGSDGGIYRSNDGGTTWVSLNTNIAITQFYSGISLHPSTATIVMGGTQDNGTLLTTGSVVWADQIGGDGGFTAIDFTNPTTRYGETQWIAGESYIGPRRSTAGGPYNLVVSGINRTEDALFIPPLKMSPTSASTLYFGTFRLYKTTNQGDTWTAISPNLTGAACCISNMAEAKSNGQVVYVGTDGGKVQVTQDGGATWTDRSAGLPSRYVTDIEVHPTNAATAYVTMSGFGASGHVFRTTDSGATWTNISGNLPNIPVNAIVVDPGEPATHLYVGTDVGVYRTTDSGTSWTPFSNGLPNSAVFDMVYNEATNTLIAATHGRGMFKAQVGGGGGGSNDNFASPTVISGAGGTSSGNSSAATRETGEPVHYVGTAGNRSLWWRWTAPSTGQATFDTTGSGFDTVLSIYAGSSLTGLTQIMSNDDSGGVQSRVSFHAVSGTTYQIAVDGKTAGAGGAVTLAWTLNTTQGNAGLVAAVLPYARSVQAGSVVTAFATIINATGAAATGCYLQMPHDQGLPGVFQYQTASPSNTLTGTANTPVNIGAGAQQQFMFGFTPSAAFAATDVRIAFDCENTQTVATFNGVNTFLLSSSATPVPDMVAIGATPTADGILRVPGPTGVAAFAAAAVNIGVAGSITATVDTGGATLPLAIFVCQTNPGSGACLSPPAASTTSSIANNEVVTYAVFVTASGAVALNAATNRIFLRLSSGGVTRGATSVAVTTVPAGVGKQKEAALERQ